MNLKKLLESAKKGVEFIQEKKELIEEAAETLATLKEELDEAKDSIMAIKDMATSMFNNDDDTKTEQNKEQNDVPLIAPKQKGNGTTKPTPKQADAPVIAEAKAEGKSVAVASSTKQAEEPVIAEAKAEGKSVAVATSTKQADAPVIAEAKAEGKSVAVASSTKHAEAPVIAEAKAEGKSVAVATSTKHAEAPVIAEAKAEGKSVAVASTTKQAEAPVIAEAKAEDKSVTVTTTPKHAEVVEVIEVCNSTDSKKEDTFFEDMVGLLGDTVSNTNPQNPTEVVAALSVLAQAAQETTKYVLEQEVKREEIRAKKEVAIHQINAISEGVKLYLEKTFDERSAIFSKQFECIDEALKKGDNELLAITLNNINSLATSSPFKNLADINSVQHALGNGDTEWDI